MKALILAAGRGSRLAPLTDNKPKCLVEYQGKAILSYEIEALLEAGIDEVGIVGGYLAPELFSFVERHYKNRAKFSFFINERHDSTNMVATLFSAREFLSGDLILSYSDIIYSARIVKKLMEFEGEVGVIIDKEWRTLWERRFSDPLSDAETLKIREGKIREIGKKPRDFSEIEGQYIGLMKFSSAFLPRLIEHYEHLDPRALYEGKALKEMYMTTLLQSVIERFDNVKPVMIQGGWGEIDSVSDLSVEIRL